MALVSSQGPVESAKMRVMVKILLTGRPGVGKTTVIRKAVASGLSIAGGFFTEEIRQGGQRLGFRVKDLHTGEEGLLAHVDHRNGPRVGKYTVDVASFARIGVEALRQAATRQGCIIMDEIGKMELSSKAFAEVAAELMESDHAILATIPAIRHPLLDRLRARPDATVIEVTLSNRDSLPGRIVELLKSGSRQARRE